MTGLLDRYGKPMASYKKASPPPLGERYGAWAGDDNVIRLPGGGALTFNLDTLRLSDFRSMRDHYQVNASLSVLTFMLHQLTWHIECKDNKIAEQCEENLRNVWTRLVRAKSTAFWAGRSPNILQWENDANNRTVQLTKVKDLLPEDCTVQWKRVNGQTTKSGQKTWIKVYDGLRQVGWAEPIPVRNTYWYPLLMENGNYYGRKILRAAFVPWFFSNLMHLYSNRYYERFGEPLPVGRAPFDEEVDLNGKKVRGNVVMGQIMQSIRNRSVAVLPNTKTPASIHETHPDWDYQLEYLESQMRGVDFDRYISRLDEEITLGLFTPLLITRTSDVGSYNLGVGHMQTYQWMLNAIAADWAEYINKYILSPMTDMNFSENAPRPKIVFKELGVANVDTTRAVLQTLVAGVGDKRVVPDIRELGELTGMTLKEIDLVMPAPTTPPGGVTPPAPGTVKNPDRKKTPKAAQNASRATVSDISERVKLQVQKAFKTGTFGPEFTPSFGYERRMEESFVADGFDNPEALQQRFYSDLSSWSREVIDLGEEGFKTPDEFMTVFDKYLVNQIDAAA